MKFHPAIGRSGVSLIKYQSTVQLSRAKTRPSTITCGHEREEWSTAPVIAAPNTILSTIVTRYLRARNYIQRHHRETDLQLPTRPAVLYRRFCIIRGPRNANVAPGRPGRPFAFVSTRPCCGEKRLLSNSFFLSKT